MPQSLGLEAQEALLVELARPAMSVDRDEELAEIGDSWDVFGRFLAVGRSTARENFQDVAAAKAAYRQVVALLAGDEGLLFQRCLDDWGADVSLDVELLGLCGTSEVFEILCGMLDEVFYEGELVEPESPAFLFHW